MTMRSRSKWLIVVAATMAVVMAATPVAMAGGRRIGRRIHGGLEGRPVAQFVVQQIGRLLTLKQEVDLSKTQRLQLWSIFEQNREEIVGAARAVIDKRRALHNATLAEQPDEKAIRTAAAELGKVIGDAAVLRGKLTKHVRGVLTDDQQAAVKKFRAETQGAVDALLDELAGKK
jgi:Spy/CpxP family protein refolding chaperone